MHTLNCKIKEILNHRENRKITNNLITDNFNDLVFLYNYNNIYI